MDQKHSKSLISALWEDGYKLWALVGPTLSGLYWMFIWVEREAPEVKELSFAWGFLPILIWVFVSYVRRWQAYKVLAERLTPGFELSLHCPRDSVPGANTDVLYKFINVSVYNSSEVNLEQCTALLESVLKDGNQTKFDNPIPLYWNFPLGANEKTVIAGENGVVNIIASGSHGHDMELWNKIKWTRYQNIFNDSATYRLKVRVNCGGVSNTIEFDVKWNGKWDEIEANEMKNG